MTRDHRDARDLPEAGAEWGEVDLSMERPAMQADDRTSRRMMVVAGTLATALLAGVFVYAAARPGAASSRLTRTVGPAVAELPARVAAQHSLEALRQAAALHDAGSSKVAQARARPDANATGAAHVSAHPDLPPSAPNGAAKSSPGSAGAAAAGDGEAGAPYGDLPTLDDLPSGADILDPGDLVDPAETQLKGGPEGGEPDPVPPPDDAPDQHGPDQEATTPSVTPPADEEPTKPTEAPAESASALQAPAAQNPAA